MNAPQLLVGSKDKVTAKNFPDVMQQAIGIEIATIPVYLYTYYSLMRSPDQDALEAQITSDILAADPKKTQAEAQKSAEALALELMVFANKSGALIMSVVIEEMLHMSLSANVKQAIAGEPQLIGQAPSTWPAYLPGHQPEFAIDRAGFSFRQLYTFLQIESPNPLPEHTKLLKAQIDYPTIGQFYDKIIDYIKTLKAKDFDPNRPQLIPGMGYYTNNTIDTVYYNKKHKPQFPNAADSGDLVHVKNVKTAVHALELIKDQGEGNTKVKGLNGNGTVDCSGPSIGDYDDPKDEEYSHFEKFNDLYCELHRIKNKFDKAFGKPVDNNPPDLDPKLKGVFDPDKYLKPEMDEWFTKYFVYQFPTNPSMADYPQPAQKVAALANAIYSYLFIMSEECYKKSGNTQYEIFMFGIHKSMIFILSTLCEEIRAFNYRGKDGKEYTCSVTFEEHRFSAASSPKEQVVALFNDASAAYSNISGLGTRINDLPDVPLEPYLSKDNNHAILD